jgi:hypothetical protein
MSSADNLQRGIARARAANEKIVEPGPRQLQIDLDGLGAVRVFCRQLAMLDGERLTRGWRYRIAPSFTRGHLHVTITLPRPAPLRDRVLLAALLGSDLKREAFNYIRGELGRRVPVAFFESRADKNRRERDIARVTIQIVSALRRARFLR